MRHKEVPNDYISRYELVKHLTGVEDGWRHPFQYGELQEEILHFPAADVKPVRHGKWMNEEQEGFNVFSAECDQCGKRTLAYFHYNFCPFCGADMREDA